MPSINLLPKKLRFKESEENQKKLIFVFSVFLLLTSAIFYIGVHINKTIVSDESEALDLEMEKINAEIEKEISDNELFLMKNEIKDIAKLLNGHNYFSKAFSAVQNIITEDVYLKDSKLSLSKEGNLTMEISGVANSYLSAANQIAVFKNSYWINKVKINDISSEEESGVNFSGSLEFKKEIVSFHKYYWDFGLALLSSKTDRYLKINEYSAALKKSDDNSKNFVEVKFGGIAYDEKKLTLLEDDLRQMNIFVKDVLISYDLRKKNSDGTVDFNGEMKLNMF